MDVDIDLRGSVFADDKELMSTEPGLLLEDFESEWQRDFPPIVPPYQHNSIPPEVLDPSTNAALLNIPIKTNRCAVNEKHKSIPKTPRAKFLFDNGEPVPPEKITSDLQGILEGRKILTAAAYYKRAFRFVEDDQRSLSQREVRKSTFNYDDQKTYLGKREIVWIPIRRQPSHRMSTLKQLPSKPEAELANSSVSVIINCPLSNTSLNQIEKYPQEIYKICQKNINDPSLNKQNSITFFKKLEQQVDSTGNKQVSAFKQSG